MSQWTPEALHDHLDMVINTEWFTIPLYLTAASSIIQGPSGATPNSAPRKTTQTGNASQKTAKTGDAPSKTATTDNSPRKTWNVKVGPSGSEQTFSVHSTIISVAVQEMYHLLWACNLAKAVTTAIPAVDYRLSLSPPDYSRAPPFLPLTRFKGLGSLADLIDVMVEIEQPDPVYNQDYSADPERFVALPGPKKPHKKYDSLAALYHALANGITALWPTEGGKAKTISASGQLAYSGSRKEKYSNVRPITDLRSALETILAIVEQGEGAGADKHIEIPTAFQDTGQATPAKNGVKPADPGDKYTAVDEFTHYERFLEIQKGLDASKVYQTPSKTTLVDLTGVLTRLEKAYAGHGTLDNDFYTAMSSVGTVLDALWARGTLPIFTLPKSGSSGS